MFLNSIGLRLKEWPQNEKFPDMSADVLMDKYNV